MATQMKSFSGARVLKDGQVQAAPRVVCARRSVAVKADGAFIGSSTNFIVCLSTVAFLGAGRFGFAPSVAKVSTAGLKLVDRDIPLKSNDPAGFTIVDCLALGTMGHIVGVGIVLGLKATGSI